MHTRGDFMATCGWRGPTVGEALGWNKLVVY
jgi:hypothetical protein